MKPGPIWGGIFGGFLNDTAERLGWSGKLIARDGCCGTRRTGCAGDFLGWRWQGDEHRRRSRQQKERPGRGQSEEASIPREFIRNIHVVGGLIF